MKLCEVCPKRDTCQELCEKAEAVVSQDYRYQKEASGVSAPSGGENTSTVLELLAVGARISWQDVQDATQGHEFPVFSFLRDSENNVLKAYYAEGLKCKQIARKYSIKCSTVKQQLRRAKKKLVTFSLKKGKA